MSRRTRRMWAAEANAQSSNDCFPAEILTEIFASLQDQLFEEFSGRERLQWVRVTHVSQRWRSIAIGCARLWANIQSGDPAIREWLKRAQGTALFVDLKIGTTRDEAAFNMALRKLSQIRTLAIEILPTTRDQTYVSLWPKVLSLLANPAPMLKSFHLEDRTARPRSPVDLFASTTPRLCLLEFHGFNPSLASLFLERTTTLSICNPSPQLDPRLTLTALARMPFLETLHLECGFLRTWVTGVSLVPVNTPTACLINLKSFIFTGVNFDFDIDFLAHLSLNVDTLITFVSRIHHPDLSALSRLIQVHNCARGGPAPIQLLRVCWNDKALELVTLNRVRLSEELTRFRVEGAWVEDEFPTPWGEQLLQLPLTNLRYFGTNCALGAKAWEALSKKCPHISLLSLSGIVAFELFSCLFDDIVRQHPLLREKYAKESSRRNKISMDDESAVGLTRRSQIFKLSGFLR
ncbi:hypothetical protein BDN72DRAFT_878948 [Pluteus cervinus]|uniref:Uncharacterized protein n=1 Tax=Pluteus cervinus TaxID=181527 RepID=A0ACD3ASQ8_9AGAR|nr:hypothetical protein BDN72DRAFT_878948 [Pluteus cervinus]